GSSLGTMEKNSPGSGVSGMLNPVWARSHPNNRNPIRKKVRNLENNSAATDEGRKECQENETSPVFSIPLWYSGTLILRTRLVRRMHDTVGSGSGAGVGGHGRGHGRQPVPGHPLRLERLEGRARAEG